jgi:hypothetical protein
MAEKNIRWWKGKLKISGLPESKHIRPSNKPTEETANQSTPNTEQHRNSHIILLARDSHREILVQSLGKEVDSKSGADSSRCWAENGLQDFGGDQRLPSFE